MPECSVGSWQPFLSIYLQWHKVGLFYIYISQHSQTLTVTNTRIEDILHQGYLIILSNIRYECHRDKGQLVQDVVVVFNGTCKICFDMLGSKLVNKRKPKDYSQTALQANYIVIHFNQFKSVSLLLYSSLDLSHCQIFNF